MDKEERIEREEERLKIYYRDIPQEQKAIVEGLIQNSAFLVVTLRDLQKEINKNGVIDTYQNGANQSGTKASAELQSYNQTIKSYSMIQKQLLSLLPEGTQRRRDTLEEALKIIEQQVETDYSEDSDE